MSTAPSSAGTAPLLVSVPLPPALPVPAYDGTDDDRLRERVRELAAGQDWAALDWRSLIIRLIALGRTNVPLSRLTEGHIDAVRILDQAGRQPEPAALYGVWASKSGATGTRLTRTVGGWQLDGTLRFASGSGVIDRALVPAALEGGEQVLIDLPVGDLPVDRSGWRTGAMAQSRSHTVTAAAVEVGDDRLVGPLGFYLDRPGFWPGGIGVAAVWTGGLARLTDLVLAWLGDRRSPAIQTRLGLLRMRLAGAATTVTHAAGELDRRLTPDARLLVDVADGELFELATEVRAVVGAAVRDGIEQVRAIAGPAGLAFAADLTQAVDDLGLYVLQQNADSDATTLGQSLGR